MMKQLPFVVSFVCLCTTYAQAQETSDLTDVHFYPPSAVSMMKYIDYPVSHRTGIPDVSIPLYTLRSGKLELPITLSFHLDDFTRANQQAGSTGAGWSLSCDLQVSRIINGRDDFHEKGYLTTGTSNVSINNETPEITPSDSHLFSMWTREIDEEPDKFYYKLCTSDGSFYIEKNLGPVNVPVNGDKITCNRNGRDADFTIIATNGTKYTYSSQYTDWVQGFNEMDLPSATAWKCTKIESADGCDSITFSYLPYSIDFIEQLEMSLELYDNAEISGHGSETFEALARTPRIVQHFTGYNSKDRYLRGNDAVFDYWEENTPSDPSFNPYVNKIFNTIHHCYPDEIMFRGGKVRFIYEQYSADNRSITKPFLNKLEIYDTHNTLVKTISFTQQVDTAHYLERPVAELYSRYLTALTIGAESYQFTYGVDHLGYACTDFWGYEVTGDYTSGSVDIPQHKIEIEKGLTPRGRNGEAINDLPLSEYEKYIPSYYQTSIYDVSSKTKKLLSIRYPTGGYTEFHCDNNQFCDRNGTTQYISSYRVKNIRYFDQDSTLLKETCYAYGPDGNGNGILRHEPDVSEDRGNCHTLQNIVYYEMYDGATVNYIKARCRTFYPHTTYRTNYNDGSYIQYEEVAEYQRDSTLSGKTIYKYDLDPPLPGALNRPLESIPESPYPMEGEFWHQGLLDSVIQYKYNGSSFEWIARTKYKYEPYVSNHKIYRGRVWPTTRHIQILENGSFQERPRLTFSPYEDDKNRYTYSYNAIDIGCMQLVQEDLEQRGDDGRILHQQTKYYYEANPYTVGRRETTYADGRTVTEQTLYAESYPAASMSNMLSRNLLSLPLERIVYTENEVTQGETFSYDIYGRPDSLSILAAQNLSLSSFRLSNKNSAGSYTGAGTGSYLPDDHYIGKASLHYDADGNICEVQSVGQAPICYLWGYKGLYLVAEIRNATYDEVKTALGTEGVERIRTSTVLTDNDLALLNGLRTAYPAWHVTTATYIPLIGMSSMTDPSGRSTSYEYDTYGRLISIKDGQNEVIQTYTYHLATENQ